MKKRNKIILISLCLILIICAASTAGVLIWKKTAEKAPVSEEVLVDGGKASVSDEAALRELLLKEEELVITLTEDITVDESLVVKGKKTLSGTGSIKMALYVMPYESLITVAENATLILDGVTVNGNGIANGVKVEKTANLTLLSGEVAWGNPYGIEVQGNAEIKGGTITDAIHTGIFIGTSGNVQMSAGNVKSAGYASTRISKGGYFGFSGDAILQNCGVYHIHNAGTCDVTGGVVRDSEYTLATTEGDLNIHYQGTDGGMIEWYNATGSGIYVGEGGNLNASGFYVHDVGYAGVNSGQGTGAIKMTNCKFENTGNNGLHIKMATAELKDIEIIKPGKHGVFVNSPTTTATIENLTVTEPAERGLHNAGAKTTAKNVTVTSPGTYGVSTGISGDTVGSLVVENLTVTEAGSNPENSQPAVNCYKSSLTVIGATLTDSNNAGARVTDGGQLTLKNVKIKNTESYGVYVVHDKSKATLENVSVANTGKHGVYVNNGGAKADISKLTVTNAGERGIHNAGGIITAKNVTINGSGLYGVSTGNHTDSKTGKSTAGSVTIDNLTVTGAKGDAAVNSYKSVLTITNGKITDSAKVGARVTDGGTLKLTDVEITKTGYEGVLVSSAGKATLKNSVVTNAGKHGVYVYKANSEADIDTLTVVEPAERGLHNAGGTITAKNVTITNSGLYGVSTGNYTDEEGKVTAGSVTIDNLTVTGAKGDSAVNSYKSVLTVTNAKIKDSAKVGARVTDAGKLSLTDVEITSTGAGYEGVLVTSKGQATLKNVTVTKSGKHGVYVKDADSKADIDTLTVTEPVERGLHNAGGTITAKNVTITSPGTYGVSTGSSGESKGSVTVTNLTVTNAGAIPVVNEDGSKTIQPAVNSYNSVLTVTDAKLIDSNGIGARVTDGGELNLKNVEIENAGQHGVYVVHEGSVANIEKLTVTNAGLHGVYVNGDAETYATDVTINTTNKYTLDSKTEYGDVRVSAGGYAEMEKVSITGSKEHGIYVDSNSELNLSGINSVTSSGKHGVFANGANAKININMQEGATVEKDYLTITSTAERGLYNVGGTVQAKNVTIITPGHYGVATGSSGNTLGSVTVENLTVTGAGAIKKYPAVNSYKSVLNISNATIEDSKEVGARVTDGGTLNLTDVRINNSASYGIYINHANSVANVTGVKINGTTAGDGIYVTGGGVLNLSGVSSIANAKAAGVYVAVNSTANINAKQDESTKEFTGLDKATNNLTITGGTRGIYNVGGTVTAYHVSVSDTSSYGVQSEYSGTTKGSAIVNDLSVSGAKGTASIYSKGSELTVTDATLTNSKGHGALINYGGILNLTDATIDGTASGKNGIHLDGDSGESKAYLTNLTLRDVENYGVHAYGKDGYIEIDGLKVIKSEEATYSSKRGIANKGATIVASDVEIDYGKEYSVSSYAYMDGKVLVSKGEMTIDNLTVTNSVRDSIHVNNCTVTINGATLTGFSRWGAVVYTGGVLNLNDAQINATGTNATGTHGIFLEGTNSTVNLNGTSSITNATVAGIYVQNKTVANINNTSGTLTITNCETGIHNIGGNVTAKNVVVNTPNVYGVLAEAYVDEKTQAVTKGTATITGLTVNGAKIQVSEEDATDADAAVFVNNSELTIIGTEEATATITNSAKNGAGVIGGGILNLTNVEIKNAGKHGIYVTNEDSVANVNGLNIDTAGTTGTEAKGYDGIRVTDKGTLKLSGESNIKDVQQHGIYVAVNSIANINVVWNESTSKYDNMPEDANNLTITDSGKRGLYNVGGTVTAYNVTTNSTGAYGVSTGSSDNTRGSVTITKLTVNGTDANAGVNAWQSDLTINGGIIQNTSSHGVLSSAGAVVNLSGTVEMNTIGNSGVHVEKNSTANIETLIVNGVVRGIYNLGGTVDASNVTVNSATTYAVHTIISDGVKGSVTVGTINVTQSSGNAAVYSNNSVLTINGGMLSNTNKDGALVNNGGRLTLQNVLIKNVGRYGVLVDGNSGSKDATATLVNVSYENCASSNTKIYGTGTIN